MFCFSCEINEEQFKRKISYKIKQIAMKNIVPVLKVRNFNELIFINY